ncbi:hypothetical protein FACUT_7801 [Fusarium acutatum]|uniref:Uncharacterized protein n=1 Tax=Fusarium acutatum TaxID=78861 RepID=A0A8H4JNW4_9HYPO|nr:hypothetical protein FACUT_7801 [Fusarium acutatum]
MSSALTTTVNIISAGIYTMVRPTGSVIDANPTATTIGLGCPSHEKIDCNQNYTNTFVVGPWASTVVPEGLPSTGTFRWYWELEREALSYECLMSSGIRKTCTGLQVPLGITRWHTERDWTRHSWTVIETEEMLDTIQLPIVLTSGLEQLGTDVQATPTEDASEVSASRRKAATETFPPVTPTLFIYDAEEYMIHTPTGSVISVNPTATTIELGCPVQSDCPFEYSNTFVVGPWASTVVPEGSASTGTFHFYLANSYWGTALSVECLMSSGMPQTCTRLVTEMQTMTWKDEDMYGGPVTETATNMYPGATLARRFTYMSIVITAGQELLGKATATSTDTASPEKTNGAGSSAACVAGVMAMAVIASLIMN